MDANQICTLRSIYGVFKEMKFSPFVIISRFLEKISDLYWIVMYSRFRNTYAIDRKFRFNGKGIIFYGKGEIIAGAESYIGGLSTLQAVEGYRICIGTGCQISHNVRVYTQSAVADHDFSHLDRPQKYGDVHFDDYCWVGANVFVNPGLIIGKNAVVGANSVVTKNIPSFEIWGGVPAKFIRRKRLT